MIKAAIRQRSDRSAGTMVRLATRARGCLTEKKSLLQTCATSRTCSTVVRQEEKLYNFPP